MSTTILCTDGSVPALQALVTGLAVLAPTDTVVLVTVVDDFDPALVSDGGGHAGPSLSPEEAEALHTEAFTAGETVVAQAAAALGREGIETRVLSGRPGPAVCEFAAEVGATAIVMGTRGRSGVKRALLGSVSDHIVRNAPCPVVVTGS